MRDAFGKCVGNLQPVRVVGGDEGMDRFVIEIDITPHAAICEDMVFACFVNGKLRRLTRQGSSNNSEEEVNRGGGNLDEQVERNANWRREQELNGKRAALLTELETMTERNASRLFIENIIRQVRTP